ncbi:GNAT family N-acetyltransferase [Pseudonocardia alaniniphila]|uniref:GNAT family N-acetyltransferase n=1 Tax=Pseudonocardia alaniniphila TaxID=75291 RepID=A0ABS9T724_9PSEU|nr:GNAT family N-acetyltransferase [Pseudonocardia alaniniphila]MCH6164228.1 GNAT family N-acetyltransferase [Pseudonocardia alaniniphila]
MNVRPAREDESTDVGRLISYSFDQLAANAFLAPDPARRRDVNAEYFTLITEHALDHGSVDVIDDAYGPELAAAAVWFDRTHDIPAIPDYDARLAALAGPFLDRFRTLDTLFDIHHPSEPHWHLAFLAVHPQRQGRGLGGELMNRTHAKLDSGGIPEYLEATNEANIRLYKRHGYTEMKPFDFPLPDDTRFFRMWRPAGRATANSHGPIHL